MEYRTFGRTGMRVSVLGLGAGGFGGVGSAPELFGKGEDQAASFAIMDRAFEAGINYFDTANSYGGGRSESYIGAWMQERKLRDRIVLSTKVFNRVGDSPDGRGLSRGQILKQIDASLRRLRTDHVDLYCIHDFDPETPLEETLSAFDEVVKAGKVRHVGAAPGSKLTAPWLCETLAISKRRSLARFESIQNEYNLLARSMEAEVFPVAANEGLAVTPFSPTAGGLLTGKYQEGRPAPAGSRLTLRPEPYLPLLTPRTFRVIDALNAAAAERGVEPGTLALAWVLSHPQVTAALIGPRRVEHFHTWLAAVDLRLSAAERSALAARLEAA